MTDRPDSGGPMEDLPLFSEAAAEPASAATSETDGPAEQTTDFFYVTRRCEQRGGG